MEAEELQLLVQFIDSYASRCMSRHVFLERTHPALFEPGFRVDLAAGVYTLTRSGIQIPIQVLGSEAGQEFLWGWANSSFRPEVTSGVQWLRDRSIGRYPVFRHPALPLEGDRVGDRLTGFALAAAAAAAMACGGVLCLKDPRREAWLYLGLADDSYLEEPPPVPAVRLADRLPLVLARNSLSPREGGISFSNRALAALGLGIEYGMQATPDSDTARLTLQHPTGRAVVTQEGNEGPISIQVVLEPSGQ